MKPKHQEIIFPVTCQLCGGEYQEAATFYGHECGRTDRERMDWMEQRWPDFRREMDKAMNKEGV